MDCWHPIIERAQEQDVIRQWAELEGKSQTMREELYRRYTPQRPDQRNSLARISIFGEIVAILLDAWWHVRCR